MPIIYKTKRLIYTRAKARARRARRGRVTDSHVISKARIGNLPNHLSSEVGHIFLCEDKIIFTPRERLKELASENAAIESVVLLWSILHEERISSCIRPRHCAETYRWCPVDPSVKVERFLLLIHMLGINILTQLL